MIRWNNIDVENDDDVEIDFSAQLAPKKSDRIASKSIGNSRSSTSKTQNDNFFGQFSLFEKFKQQQNPSTSSQKSTLLIPNPKSNISSKSKIAMTKSSNHMHDNVEFQPKSRSESNKSRNKAAHPVETESDKGSDSDHSGIFRRSTNVKITKAVSPRTPSSSGRFRHHSDSDNEEYHDMNTENDQHRQDESSSSSDTQTRTKPISENPKLMYRDGGPVVPPRTTSARPQITRTSRFGGLSDDDQEYAAGICPSFLYFLMYSNQIASNNQL